MDPFLKEIESLLRTGEPREAVARKVLMTVLQRFNSETGTIHWLDRESKLLRLAAQVGLPDQVLDFVRSIPVGKGIAGQTVERGSPVALGNPLVDSSSSAPGGTPRQAGMGAMVSVPIRAGETIIGAFGIGTARPHEYAKPETTALEEIGKLMGQHLNIKSLARAGEPSKPPADSLAGLALEAAEAWQVRDYKRSLSCLQRAHRLAPYDSRVLLELGRHHGMRCDYESAQHYFEKAFMAVGQKPETMIIAGEHSAFFGHHDLARGYFERALKKAGDLPDALASLAELHERQQQTDIAVDLIERALHANRNHARSLVARARLHRATGQPDQAEQLLRSFVNRPEVELNLRAQGWNELGLMFDKLARYDDAMSAFLQAKALLKPQAGKFLILQNHFQQRLQRGAEILTPQLFRQWQETSAQLTNPRRVALLGGHPRSGTTLLEQVLDAHPEIVATEETTIFFNEIHSSITKTHLPDQLIGDLANTALAALELARQEYFSFTEKFIQSPIGDRLLVDKNPSSTALIPSFVRVFPESRLLVALRDPRDVCLSCFMQHLPMNQASATYLDLGETTREYASLMNFWLAIRPKLANPWLEVRYEDMVENLDSVARKTLEFLGLNWDDRVLAFNEHAKAKIVRSPTYADVGKPIYKTSQGRWRHYQKYLEPHLARLEPLVKAFGYE